MNLKEKMESFCGLVILPEKIEGGLYTLENKITKKCKCPKNSFRFASVHALLTIWMNDPLISSTKFPV